jgi:hypothetical protein
LKSAVHILEAVTLLNPVPPDNVEVVLVHADVVCSTRFPVNIPLNVFAVPSTVAVPLLALGLTNILYDVPCVNPVNSRLVSVVHSLVFAGNLAITVFP